MTEGLFRTLVTRQMEAALCTLNRCIVTCPEAEWHEAHDDAPFSQVVFHTLFYTDFYLGENPESFREQPFHRENRDMLRNYEELEDRIPVHLYGRDEVLKYLAYCREKVGRSIRMETGESLCAASAFPRQSFTRAELHIDNIRHIQHHAAQLGLRVQRITGRELEWVSTGWRDM